MLAEDVSADSNAPPLDNNNNLRDDPQLSYKARRREQNPSRTRHGARNQEKSKLFVKWLAPTFRHILGSTTDAPILDVAGGKGELAARLCMCNGRTVVMVDPRQADIAGCFVSVVLRGLPKKWQERFAARVMERPNFLNETLQERYTQHAMYFDTSTMHADPLQKAIESCCLLVGLHADAATEAIVDAALHYNKPFVVVPCCVFPSLFPQRTLGEMQVRSHEQFCEYLLRKDGRFQKAVLPFDGRNIAIWWDGV
jgi:hypothetical protein